MRVAAMPLLRVPFGGISSRPEKKRPLSTNNTNNLTRQAQQRHDRRAMLASLGLVGSLPFVGPAIRGMNGLVEWGFSQADRLVTPAAHAASSFSPMPGIESAIHTAATLPGGGATILSLLAIPVAFVLARDVKKGMKHLE